MECTCVNNDDFTVLVSGGGRHDEWACVLCSCCIQNDWASRAMNLHQILHSAWTFLCGNCLDDLGGWNYGQLMIGSFITTMHLLIHHTYCRVFAETSNHPGDSDPLQPRFGAPWLLFFPQTKITFERQKISDHRWDSGKYGGAADGDWENCVRSQGAYFEGDWGIIILGTMFLASSSINVSIFHITWMDTSWTGLINLNWYLSRGED